MTMKLIKDMLLIPFRLWELKKYVEQYQPVGQIGKIQKIMGWKYKPLSVVDEE